MKNRRLVIVGFLIGLTLTVSCDRAPHAELKIATATPGGTYSVLGSALDRVLEELPEHPFEEVEPLNTAGSIANIRMLAEGRAQLGLAPRSSLVAAPLEIRQEIAVVADLYDDVVQIVVREDQAINSLRDLAGKRIYVGQDESGTQAIAMEILNYIGVNVTDQMRSGSEGYSYRAASVALLDGSLDAAFFLSGTPTEAVTAAMASGLCRLLDLSGEMSVISGMPEFDAKYAAETIDDNRYPNQEQAIRTISTSAHLVARRDLPADQVAIVLGALYDNIRELLLAHGRAEDIEYAPPRNWDDEEIHPGTHQYFAEDILLIATGSIDGIYYRTGKNIQGLLEQRKIPSRVIHTDGSFQNIQEITRSQNNVLAIVQYEAALAAHAGSTKSTLGIELQVPLVKGLRRIVTLRDEKMHVIVRRDRLGDRPPTIRSLAGLRVSIGPANSASNHLAQAILEYHDVEPVFPIEQAVRRTVDQLNAGQIDAAFFTAAVPSEALDRVLSDDQYRLLSVEQGRLSKLQGTLELTEIDGEYSCQLPGEPPVKTIGTKSVLIASSAMGVEQITRSVFDGVGFLGIQEEEIVEDLPSIPLHRDAVPVFQEKGFLPEPPSKFIGVTVESWLTILAVTGQAIVVLGIIFGSVQGLVTLRRIRNRILMTDEIFDVPVEDLDEKPLEQLQDIRHRTRDMVRKPWYDPDEIGESQWNHLEKLVAQQVLQVRHSVEKRLIGKVRRARQEVLQGDRTLLDSLKEEILAYMENGELEADRQGQHLLELLELETGRMRSSETRTIGSSR